MSATTTLLSDRVAVRDRAREHGNSVRIYRKELKERVWPMGRAGAAVIADELNRPALATLYVFQLVSNFIPRIGDRTAQKMLRTAEIDPWRKVGRLTPREAVALRAELHAHAVHRPPPTRTPTDPPRKRGTRHRCERCGEHMRRASKDGLCGFCQKGLA